jgi:hypothetical protein
MGQYFPMGACPIDQLAGAGVGSVTELQNFMDGLRNSTRTPLEKLEHGAYNVHWRGPSREGLAPSGGVQMRCQTPIQSSHDIGWNTQPLVSCSQVHPQWIHLRLPF